MSRRVLVFGVAAAAIAALVAIVIIIVISSGGNSAPPPPTPTPTMTPTATPTPTPTTSPTPTPTPADPSAAWVFESGSFGPIALGANGPETAAGLGWEHTPGDYCFELYQGPSGELVPNDPRWLVSYGAFDDGRGIQWIGIAAINVATVSPSGPKTAAGIGLGSTEAELLAAYPGAVINRDTGAYREYVVDGGNGTYLHFATGSDGAVFRLYTDTAADPDAVNYSC